MDYFLIFLIGYAGGVFTGLFICVGISQALVYNDLKRFFKE